MNKEVKKVFSRSVSRNFVIGGFLLFIGLVLQALPKNFQPFLVNKFYLTSLTTGLIILISGLLHNIFDKYLTNPQRKYILKKLVSLAGLLITILSVGIIWIESTSNIALFTGFFTVGVGVAFQDVFRSLIGTVIINSNENITIGSFIEINGLTGRILDIGFLYTTILEFESFENDGDPVGRYVEFPNSMYLIHDVKSFNKKYEYIWEEISIRIQDHKKLIGLDKKIEKFYQEIIKKDFDTKKIEQFMKREKFYLKNQAQEIVCFSNYSEGHLNFVIRVLVPFEHKKDTRTKLISFVLSAIEQYK